MYEKASPGGGGFFYIEDLVYNITNRYTFQPALYAPALDSAERRESTAESWLKERGAMTSELVYSTAHGRMCPRCGNAVAGCTCRKKRGSQKHVCPESDTIYVRRETKGRRGKPVTLIENFKGDLLEMATHLKRVCGCGGSVKEGVILLQGDRRDRIVSELVGRGCVRVKKAGG